MQALDPSLRSDYRSLVLASEAVLIEPDGSTIRGVYDGYGGLKTASGNQVDMSGEPLLYHQACYDLLGKPSFSKPSQVVVLVTRGIFVGEYDPIKPANREDVENLARAK